MRPRAQSSSLSERGEVEDHMRLELWNYFLVVLGVGVGGVRGRGAGGVLGRDGAPSECGRSPGRYEGDLED